MDKLAFVCFFGAAFRLMIYRFIGKKAITIKYLTGQKDEQQITSHIFGVVIILLFVFTITKIL